MRPHLPPRLKEIARLISLGCTTADMANILGVAESTVDNHKVRLMKTLGVRKAALITRWAIKHRLSSMNDKLTVAEKRKRGRKKDGWN